MAYSSITQANLQTQIPSFNMPQVTEEELLKINICVAHARSKDQTKPGSYETEFNRLVQANNLPNVIISEGRDISKNTVHEITEGAAYEEPELQIPKPSQRK